MKGDLQQMSDRKRGRPTVKEEEENNNFDTIYNETCKNLRRDRQMVKEYLSMFKSSMTGSNLIIIGPNIAKFVDSLTNMNKQFIELAKLRAVLENPREEEGDDEDIFDKIHAVSEQSTLETTSSIETEESKKEEIAV